MWPLVFRLWHRQCDDLMMLYNTKNLNEHSFKKIIYENLPRKKCDRKTILFFYCCVKAPFTSLHPSNDVSPKNDGQWRKPNGWRGWIKIQLRQSIRPLLTMAHQWGNSNIALFGTDGVIENGSFWSNYQIKNFQN